MYRAKDSPFYQYDFQLRGHRFHGSTREKSRREAEKAERVERERAAKLLDQVASASTSMRLDDVAGRYWNEVGQHHAGADNTWRQLEYLLDFFGKDRLLTEITGNDVAKLVAWRRGHKRRDGSPISPYTVNDTTEQLKKLFTRAKAWGVRFDHEPAWRDHWLDEPQERVRELHDDEADRLDAAMRDDLAPFFAFAKASGMRRNECLSLRWSEVDWSRGRISKAGKGGRLVTVPITSAIREILWPLRGHHPEYVFTYMAQRTRDGRVKGRRYRLTLHGLKTAWRRLRKRAHVEGFRLHDYRHNFGTKLLRSTGNIKLVQRAMNHADIGTTTRYAHVLDAEVAEAMESMQKVPRKIPRKAS
ncbi:MAG: tyrosine-type recombinase/integrase [Xanthobacteraceae bacterium]